MKNIEGF